MLRMSGMDAMMLYLETPTAHMHTIKVAIFDTPASFEGFSLELATQEVAKRLDFLPSFRRRSSTRAIDWLITWLPDII